MAELNSNEEPHVVPPKRKQTSQNLDDDSTKKLRPDNEAPTAVEEKAVDENGDKDEIEDEEEEEDYEGEDEVDSDDEDDDEDEDEHSNGRAEIDRKGKGIMKDDKGKGKMIEESEDNDSSDEDGGASESDGDDDLSDDPLAEVDLDNILPSRTRRRTAPRGVRISSNELTNDKDCDA